MTEEITELDQATVSQIAAGEVVERPASAVKELVENSLDADATRIDVEIAGGGTEFLKIVDDGVGMGEHAVRKAVRQHTTSKIRSIDDLETGLSTLGFRGEALYTIGAVSKLTITTRPRDGSDVGTELRVVGGEIEDVAPAGRGPGTTVTVEDLFFNTPARRKYLKTDTTEFAHINRVVTRYALANPDVAISLSHDGSTVFSTAGQGDLRETILAVYGREVAESMIAVEGGPSGPVTRVAGYVSDPETTRSSREYVSTFVNDRYVRDGLLREAIVDAYGNQLAPDRFPFAVLFLDVPPETVDVNVHPRKLEVRFDDDAAVRDAIAETVRNALLSNGLIRTGAPRGRSAPDDATITPESGDSAEDAPADLEEQVRAEDTLEPRSEIETDTEGTEGTDPADSAATRVDEADAVGEPSADSVGEVGQNGAGDSTEETDQVDAGASTEETDQVDADDSVGSESPSETARRNRASRRPGEFEKFRGPAEQSGLTDSGPETAFETLPPLRVLGQIDDTYVVAESPDGLVLIDQHAADERVNYERLTAELEGQRDVQQLVEPVTIDVTPQEASVFEAARSDLGEMGFEATRSGETVVVEAVPAVFSETLSPELVKDVLADFLAEDPNSDVVASAADALLADMACYPSITGGTSLRDGDVVELLRELDDCENPYACPHGRPVIIELSTAELEERFERDYPGHATRRPEDGHD